MTTQTAESHQPQENEPHPTPAIPGPAQPRSGPPPSRAWYNRYYARLWILALAIIGFDQWTKYWVLHNIPEGTYFKESFLPPYPVIPDFLYIVHIYNPGAAWGMFSGYSGVLAIIALLALWGIYHFRHELALGQPFMQYAFGLLCGGIVGNLIDRLQHGHVIDFIDVHLPGYRWPAFNIADSAITCGVGLYLIYSILEWHRTRQQTGNSA